ncbi:D-glycero-beta-D-manno-heptose 1-phosphate adenylyltransferase [Arenicella xantha]|uniref:D-glycero-beta-D-manno-heptose 1-phosphate adenylyltransferase n=1 Tax=Arenicella xantha TaxID=644221 RepID=A0A395JLK3_9GAMM|nr:D-glycero-beta-D-manno-heptose 1-phosphate adenylyltransferase [Arenicella xantha]RBP49848.1 rfaE bifunctional protein nucleotidyltransferase chain/domain [Arenicella xantha]
MMLNTQRKVIPANADIASIDAMVSALPRPLVFTNGCFDILHRGHATYLEQARNLGSALIVGVNSDASVKRQGKGDDRPVNCLEDRMSVLASLECVGAVVSFDEDTPFLLIQQILPDHLVKGGDWLPKDIVGGDIVTAHGGQVHSIAFQFERSTTALLKKIRSGG